ncbi:hypothetical protein BU26DRAFT_560683 [Trematosphaeria pertusa]|uniref:Uncharacterized protein n=1 Tax=Trematosphaeria pertusa TaxID=390896 RepID=A0A6A6IVZ8_9PLEO|nr:uncharacterized protein BU26DRAFT_560683 [Trematosphaeria pertusa]KAF2253373.1 hypothetical protein BU26DRAFT_560683 [Trematosphaeria pertusa]
MLPGDAYFILSNQQGPPSPAMERGGGFWERVRRYSFGSRNTEAMMSATNRRGSISSPEGPREDRRPGTVGKE